MLVVYWLRGNHKRHGTVQLNAIVKITVAFLLVIGVICITLTLSSLMVTICNSCFKINTSAICIYGFCMTLTVNNNYFPEQR
jgi:hypothetical protein